MKRTRWNAFLDWLAVFVATFCFVFLVLWAASPDSTSITLDMALARSFSYAFPISLGMWGIARATRRGSAVPPSMSDALPYARLGKDGKLMASTKADDEASTPPTPLGGTDENA